MKIFIAEKDPHQRYLIAGRLKVRGYEVIEAGDSLEAMKILDRERMDLALISEDMERVGTQLLIEAIRRRPHLTSIPIILMAQASHIAQLVMSCERGYDDFLIKPFDPLVLQLRVAINIERNRHRAEANPLTHLPGNHAIEKVIRKKIDKGEKFSVLYIDINNFKSFNDHYSFEKGDDVLRQTSGILMRTAEAVVRRSECFLGHIGGDDFIAVLNPDDEEKFARTFLAAFDQIIPTYYNEEDRKRGAIRVTNRRGKKENFPLMSCSVAACTNIYRTYKNLGEIARDAMEVKAFLKTKQGSHYLRDRRAEESARKLQDAERVLEIPKEDEERSGEELAPLGQLLLKAQLISNDQLAVALKEHLQTGQKLGQVLTSMRAVKSEDIGKILERKLRVPYFPLRNFIPAQDLLEIFPKDFMRLNRVFPIQRVDQKLRLGLCDPLDREMLETVRNMTHLKVIPYLILEDELEEILNRDLKSSFSRGGEAMP
ncbi:MAG: diguanylate cyclase [Candidatus Omnitrophica bacterium]|nr:diguanylate cyclase [Candidatus Omnitrophota bacterium]